MDGNGNGQAPSTSVVLTITLDTATGSVKADGPIGNPMLCMGMMEMAKQAIYDHAKELAKDKRIVPATAIPFVKH
jgi:hypothetical protein